MKFKAIYLYLIPLLNYVALVICENYYSVIAPGLLKSNRKYTVTITLHNSTTRCLIRISILGLSYNATNEVLVRPFETKNLEFFPPRLREGNYKLLAEGVKGCIFRNESELLVESEAGPRIYIQTDKAIYKPLDLVNFRVIILDEHTRPLNIKEPIRIEIFDNNENRIKQFKDISLTKGVFTGKFQLSQKPAMGDWVIRVTISGKYSYQISKEIQVKLYTLPKFSLYVEALDYFILEEPYYKAEIYGKYTFDKFVEGTLHVELRTDFTNILIDQQTLYIEGLTVVEFYIKDLDNLIDEDYLKFSATLEEKHSGISTNFSKTLRVHEKPYFIYLLDEEIEFRFSRPHRFKVHVDHYKNGPVSDLTTPVILVRENKEYAQYLNNDSVAIFEFDYKPGDEDNITLKYKDSERRFPHIYYDEPEEIYDKKYCNLTLKESPRLGKTIEVLIESSYNIPYIVFIVMGHGNIINFGLIKLPENTKNYTVQLTPSIEMIPKSYLYVHYILNGNFKCDEIALKFPPELENQISITAPKQVKPGQEVTLKLKAQPNSYVSILAVDLSVYLLDNTYDVYKETIISDLQYDQSYVYDAHIIRPGIISGVITLTNAHFPVKIEDKPPIYGANGEGSIFRTKFPETWIFDNYIINSTDTEIVLNIPETITTWRITAFSNNDITGIGIVGGPTDITTFLPFFLSLSLPYAVKRHEIVTISVTVFNYYNQSLETEITMYNKDLKFNFVEPLTNQLDKKKHTKFVNIPEGGKAVKFSIKCSEIGELEIRLTANNTKYSDGVVHKLKVVPEGITKYQNDAIYLSATTGQALLSLNIPLDSVNDSEYISLTVGGDFMIPSLDNLNDMIQMPTGCGEQNMVNFAPNILVLDYLKATGKYLTTNKLVAQAKFYIDLGYQQELSYRHYNGGYSVFGEENDEEASTWLTAYVVRFFIKASKYTAVESRIINTALEFLANQQLADGSFPYTGYLFFKELKDKHGFTAFVLLAFLEDRKYSKNYQTNIRKAFQYLLKDLHNINDIYALSIIANALSKAKHAAVDKVIEKLQNLRIENKKGLIWWSSNGTDIETTAYTLMALLNTSGDNHLGILKWLIEKRNKQGGFKSTHDTVVGLEALVKYSQKYNNGTSWDMKLAYTAKDHDGNEMKISEIIINQENAGTLQHQVLPKSVRQVNFETQGTGYTLVQLSAQYNIKNDSNSDYFSMNIKPSINNGDEMNLEVCFQYHAHQQDFSNTSNMVIMEASLPTGFKAEIDFNKNLEEDEFVQRIETKNDETIMLLYFDKLLSGKGHCVNIETFKTTEVEERQPAAVVMYDYYDISRFNTEFYTV